MMMILKWVLFALAVMLVGWLIPGISVENFQAALLAAFVIGLINVFIKPLLTFITLPVNILTLGLAGLIVNALLFLLAAKIVPGVSIEGFLAAFLGSLLLAFLNAAILKMPE